MRAELSGAASSAGEACVLGLSQHSSSALVSSAEVIVLRMALQDIKQHLHSADLQVSSATCVERYLLCDFPSAGVLMS